MVNEATRASRLKLMVQRIAKMPKVQNLIRQMQNEKGVKIDELEIVLTGRKDGQTIWQFEEECPVGRR